MAAFYLRFGLYWRFSLHLALLSRFLAKNGNCKLLIIQTVALIFVVEVEQGAQLLLREVHASLFEYTLEGGKVYRALVHDIEVLEHFHETSFFRHLCIRFLNQFVLQLFFKPIQNTQKSVSKHRLTCL